MWVDKKEEEEKCDPRNQIVAINRKLNIMFKILGEKSTIFDLTLSNYTKRNWFFFLSFSRFVCIQKVKKNETLGVTAVVERRRTKGATHCWPTWAEQSTARDPRDCRGSLTSKEGRK